MGVRIPRGIITCWTGSIANIPLGWHLCDGSAGTPDLRNRFIIGAGDTYSPRDTGGSATHTHTGSTDGHDHELAAGTGLASGANYNDFTESTTDNFTTDPGSSLQPYYALCYIMRL